MQRTRFQTFEHRGENDLILRNSNTGGGRGLRSQQQSDHRRGLHGHGRLELAVLGRPAISAALPADGSTSQLVQAMAGFGDGAADDSNAVSLEAETSRQTFLTTPHA